MSLIWALVLMEECLVTLLNCLRRLVKNSWIRVIGTKGRVSRIYGKKVITPDQLATCSWKEVL